MPSAFPDDFFEPPTTGMGRRAVHSGAVTVAAQACKQVVLLAGSMTMARVLAPGDYGLVAMATSFAGFFELFKDLGLPTATVQSPRLDHQQFNALFWINAMIGVVLASLMIAASPLFVAWYGKQELIGITVAIAVGLVAASLSIQHHALLRRKMRFGTIAIMEVASTAIAVAAGIAAALGGLGYWSILVLIVSNRVVLMLFCWRAARWKPETRCQWAPARGLVKFGAGVMVHNFVTYAARCLDVVLLGRTVGAHALGLYTRALSLAALPIGLIETPLNSVAVSSLSRLQEQPDTYRAGFIDLLYLVAACMAMFALGLSLAPSEVLGILYGPQWLDASRMAQWLALFTLFLPVNNLITLLLISFGRTKQLLRWGALMSSVLAVVFLTCSRVGPEAVAMGYGLALVVLLPAGFALASAGTPCRAGELLRIAAAPSGAALAASALAWLLAPAADGASAIARLAAGYAVFGTFLVFDARRRGLVPRAIRLFRKDPA